ncbi:Holin [Cupriavidus sp. H19C3]|uniref:hypothetical protein n=1 Tax=Cupriavidus sp. H19C3 TaxID=3241603 RepID=UPI003BF85ABC
MSRVTELITDERTGRLSHTKLWPNVANAVATVMFVRTGWLGQLTPEIWWAYLGGVGGYTAVMRIALALRERKAQ